MAKIKLTTAKSDLPDGIETYGVLEVPEPPAFEPEKRDALTTTPEKRDAPEPTPKTPEPTYDPHMPVATLTPAAFVRLGNALDISAQAVLDALVKAGLVHKSEAARIKL